MIGDYPTQSFFRIDPFSGNITNTVSLKSDNLRSQQYIVSGLYSFVFFKFFHFQTSIAHIISVFQARIIAFDTARPTASAVSTVNIFVIRNPNSPQFLLPSYSTTINENQAIGQFILNVTAVDADVQVCHLDQLNTGIAFKFLFHIHVWNKGTIFYSAIQLREITKTE